MAATLTQPRTQLPSNHILVGVLTIATLTLTEALRRRFWLAGLVVCLFFGMIALLPLHISPERAQLLGPEFPEFVGQTIGNLGSVMIEFFGFLFSVALGAGAISAELDRGTLAVILPKPLPRWAVYTGKWLGINLFLFPLTVVLIALLQGAIWIHVKFTEPGLWHALGAIYVYPLLFSTVTLCFSTFASNLLATIMPMILASAAWSEGILRTLGWTLDLNSLKVAANWVIYIVPLNPMSRFHEQAENFPILKEFPFGRVHPWPPDPPAGNIDIAWIAGYIIAAWVIGLVVFQKRDL